MDETRQIKKAIGTVRRKKAQDLLAVLFFLLLLPYTCSALAREKAGAAVETMAPLGGNSYIMWEWHNGVWRIPEEEFLIGALAACIPGEYLLETLKAQAVILRSTCKSETTKLLEDAGVAYLDQRSRRELWKEDFEEYEEKFTQAVRETSGIVTYYKKEVVSPPYFRISAGQTRDSTQIWEGNGVQGGMPWCRAVDCPYDLEALDYLQSVSLDRKDFVEILNEEGVNFPKQGGRIRLIRDSAGYVLFAECEGEKIEGEKFRKLFGLASACFTVDEKGGEVLLTTKGVGHGLGFNQYAADLLAGDGMDYQQLLSVFFHDLTLEKVE